MAEDRNTSYLEWVHLEATDIFPGWEPAGGSRFDDEESQYMIDMEDSGSIKLGAKHKASMGQW